MTERPSPDREPEPTTPAAVARPGRRALILATATAGAGAALGLAGRAAPAAAATDANGGPVLLGEANTATASTSITCTGNGAFAGTTSANGGHSGVHGNDTSSDGGYGVAGSSTNGYGVVGSSTNGTGVQGSTTADGGSGVAGVDNSGLDLSRGVSGTSSIGYGVFGSCPDGIAVYGEATNGIGVYAIGGTIGLQVQGPSIFQGSTQFSNSGVATVKKGASSVTVKLAGATVDSIVLATPQELRAGIAVAAAVPTTGSFTITLTGKASANTNVGWFVIG